LCGRKGRTKKEQSLLYDWYGKLAGEADWAQQSAKYDKKRKVKFNEWKN
jgi:hypothetical protein